MGILKKHASHLPDNVLSRYWYHGFVFVARGLFAQATPRSLTRTNTLTHTRMHVFVCRYSMRAACPTRTGTVRSVVARSPFVPAFAVLGYSLSLVSAFTWVCFPVFVLKQCISVVQLVTACQTIVHHDEDAIAAKGQ